MNIVTNPAVTRCATASAAALGSMGMRTLAIDTASCPVPTEIAGFTLPEVPARISPMPRAIPLKFIGDFLARTYRANPDVSQDVGDPSHFRAVHLPYRRSELKS